MSIGVKITVGKGLDDFIQALDSLQEHTNEMVEEAIKPGAGCVADEVRSAIRSLPRLEREPRNFKGTKDTGKPKAKHKPSGRLPAGITDVEREGLLNAAKKQGMGLAPIRNDDGFINTKLGFDGYNRHVTPSYPKGHPNVMVARSLEKGTSYRAPTPFIKPAANRTKAKAEKLMVEKFQTELKKQMHQYMLHNLSTGV